MKKLNTMIDTCRSYIAKICPVGAVGRRSQDGSQRRQRIGLLATLSCGLLLLASCEGPEQTSSQTIYQVSLLAGSVQGYKDGLGAEAQFNKPYRVTVGIDGTVYVTDAVYEKDSTKANRIRKITPAGLVSLLAGSGVEGAKDGLGAEAQFNRPRGIALGPDGTAYVADTGNHKIRKIALNGEVSLLAGSGVEGDKDGLGAEAQFIKPNGLAVAQDGTVYVADDNRIRKITPSGEVSLLAGSTAGDNDGQGAEAEFNFPSGVAVGLDGTIYVADQGNNRIRKITPAGVVSLLAGSTAGDKDGTGSEAQFNQPLGIAVGPDGMVYVADTNNHRIRKITPSGEVSLLAGSAQGYKDGPAAEAQFDYPTGVAVGLDGTVYVADHGNNQVRKITPKQVATK